MKFEFLTNSQSVSTLEFLENIMGEILLIFSHEWVSMDIYEFGHDHICGSRDCIVVDIM